ncbi:MAG: CAP domain-containing protein [bacterium]
MKNLLLLSIFLFLFSIAHGQKDTVKFRISDVCLSETELEIYKQINQYRKEKGLDSVPLSKSLTYVAQVHVRDLAENHPNSKRCNMHSWSDQGIWTPCCYTKDKKKAECMWNKPKELTNYISAGFEIAFWTNIPFLSPVKFAALSLKEWKKSPAHHQVIVNLSPWDRFSWMAMGVGYYKGYAVVWFGELDDFEAGPVSICKE